MQRQLRRITGLFCILLLAAVVTAGTWSTNNFTYEPSLGARGTIEKDIFATGLRRVDAHLGRYKTLGDPNYSTLAEALTTIGSTEVTLTIPAGTFAIGSNTTIGNNIALRVLKGGKFSVNSGVSLTINGTIDAGPYQIFAGAGTVTLGGVSAIYDVWYATPPSSPQGQIAAPVGSRFIKTAGSAPLVFVKESGTGNTGWVAAGSGGGASNFTGLTDTPSSYTGQAGKSLRVNSAASALEFYTPSSTGGVKPFITLGESGYATLSEALATIGSTATTLVIPPEAGSVSVTTNTTIPANVDLRVNKGGKFAVDNGVTLTINGPIKAGPYQIFSWTGTGAITINNSPTADCPLPWWGAVSGTGNDCSPAFAKAHDGLGAHQNLIIPIGTWRIATPVVFTKTSGFGLIGQDYDLSRIYIDVGPSNDGITVGVEGSGVQGYRFKDLNIIGPSNSCFNGLKLIRLIHGWSERVNFRLGATNYAIVHRGTQHGEWWWRLGLTGASEATMANGIKMETDSQGWSVSSSNRFRIHKSGSLGGGYGLHMTDVHDTTITGIIENCGISPGIPIYMEKCSNNVLHDIHLETNEDGLLLKDCHSIEIRNVNPDACRYDAGGGQSSIQLQTNLMTSWLKNCQRINIKESNFGALEIDAGCRNIVLQNIAISEPDGLKDYAPDTTYLGGVSGRDGLLPKVGYNLWGQNTANYLTNTLFDRWQSDRPDGWSKDGATTWTQCGEGKEDATRHMASYSAKCEVSAEQWLGHSLSAEQLQALKGAEATMSVWVKIPAGQTFSADNFLQLHFSVDVPEWQANTVYIQGEAVKPTTSWLSGHPEYEGGVMWVCVGAGATGSAQPNWTNPPNQGARVTDGTVTWMAVYNDKSNVGIAPITSADVGGPWKKMAVSQHIPWNAVSASPWFIFKAQTSGNGTYYLAEPCLTIGSAATRGVLPGRVEHQSFIKIGGIKIDTGTAPPSDGRWCNRGDVRYNSNSTPGQPIGWQCSTPGTAGSTAVWKPMGNLAN